MNKKLNNAIGNISEKFIDEALGGAHKSRFNARYVVIPAAAAAVAAGVFAAVNFGGKAPDRGVSLIGGNGAAEPGGSISQIISSAAENDEIPEEAESAQPAEYDFPEDYALPAPEEYTPDISVYGGNTSVEMPVGTPVYAAYDGEVIYTGYYHGWGYCCQIKLDDGNFVRYGHLSEFAAEKGERVSRGQVIGYSGNSGMTEAPALAVRIYSPDDSEHFIEMTCDEVKATPWNTMTDDEIIRLLNTYKCDLVDTYIDNDFDGGSSRYFVDTSDRAGRIIMEVDSSGGKVDMLNYFDERSFSIIHLRGDDEYLAQQWQRLAEYDEFYDNAGGGITDLWLDFADRMTIYAQSVGSNEGMHRCYPNALLTNEVSVEGYIAPIEGAVHYSCGDTHEYTAACLREQQPAMPYYRGEERYTCSGPQCSEGSPVLAVNDGTVAYSGVSPLGRLVVIKHGGGLESWYRNISSELSVGDKVAQGDVIGSTESNMITFLLNESESADMISYMRDKLMRVPYTPMEWEVHDGERLTVDILNSLGDKAFDREALAGYAHSECALDVWQFDLGNDIKLSIGGGQYILSKLYAEMNASVFAEVDIS